MKTRKATAILLSFLLLIGVILSTSSIAVSAESEAQAYLDKQMEEYDIIGVAYVTKNGEVLCQSARGMADTENGKEMTTDTLFPIGSVSKQFCATAILLLQEQGKLSVDDTLSQYFPEYTIGKDITVKNLLSMRSGVRNHLEGLFTEYKLSEAATAEENEQTILNWLYTKPLKFKAGNNFDYSNANFFLLSLIVEQVSGQSYQDFIKENIFKPLEMNNSGFYEELMDSPDLAEHTAPDDGMPIDPELKGLAQGAGDLVSNAKDMDKWLTALGDCTLLSEESTKEMTTNYSGINSYGYGICVEENGTIYHNGLTVSYKTVALTNPVNDFNLFVVSNDYDDIFTMTLEDFAFGLELELNLTNYCGDVNGDKVVNIKDATMIQKASAKLITLEENQTLRADVNSDTKINVKDATAIQKYVAQIETDLPIGEVI